MPRRVYRSDDQDRPVHKKHGVLHDVRMHFKVAYQEFKDFMKEAFPEPTAHQKQEHAKYVKKVEEVYKVINLRFDEAEDRFHDTKNVKEAVKEIGRMIHACLKALQVVMVKGAEEIGLIDMARAAGVVKSDPIKIMEKLKTQVDAIGPTIIEEKLSSAKKEMKNFTKDVKEGAKEISDAVKGVFR